MGFVRPFSVSVGKLMVLSYGSLWVRQREQTEGCDQSRCGGTNAAHVRAEKGRSRGYARSFGDRSVGTLSWGRNSLERIRNGDHQALSGNSAFRCGNRYL